MPRKPPHQRAKNFETLSLSTPAFSTSLLDSFIALMFAYEEGCEAQLAFAGTISIASPYEKKR
jgi:hypothetical protein